MSANERAFIAEENYSYQKYLWILLNLAHEHRLLIETIGTDTSKHTGIIYPIYRLVIHPKAQQTICIVAGIHGNEIAGPLAVLHLLSLFIHELPKKLRYVIYPLLNPTGFDLRQRFDADGRDLNAIYEGTLKSKNYVEVQRFFEDSQQYAPFEAILTLHEDSDLEKFYMYGLGEENRQFYQAICAYARTWIEPWANADIYGYPSDDFGLILATARDHAFDGALYKKGMAKVAYTLETPGKLEINFRINLMTQLVLLSLEMLDSKRWVVVQR